MLSAAPRSSTTSCRRSGAPDPRLGQHSREVLTEVGYNSDEIDDLIGRGVLLAS